MEIPENPTNNDIRDALLTINQSLTEGFEEVNKRIDQTNERVDQTNERVDRIEKDLSTMRTDVVKWDDRFFQLTRDANARANTIIIAAASVVVLSAVAQALPSALDAIATIMANTQ